MNEQDEKLEPGLRINFPKPETKKEMLELEDQIITKLTQMAQEIHEDLPNEITTIINQEASIFRRLALEHITIFTRNVKLVADGYEEFLGDELEAIKTKGEDGI